MSLHSSNSCQRFAFSLACPVSRNFITRVAWDKPPLPGAGNEVIQVRNRGVMLVTCSSSRTAMTISGFQTLFCRLECRWPDQLQTQTEMFRQILRQVR
ncbi:hypothetical protein PoB_002651200 [Plakobranchus ocellatus]|uniref:Uncharacterized protein n=1 Tax=Plakobranchus ocellatus TaxID=259542 RepID=A0AAV3ZY63_9GAST|nr:hypothetical protein PoB_002651200 [Plakobranchus ocellatus]